MSRRQYSLMPVFLAAVVFLGGAFAVKVFADGFVDKVVQIDGINAQVTRDDQNNLEFLGVGVWNGAVMLSFSPSVQAHYRLGSDIETESDEIMGKYSVTFNLAPKSSDANSQNLKITVSDQWGSEMESEVVMTAEASGVDIEVAATKKPFEFRISYSPSPSP
jgi:hypothetical protein